MADYRGIDIKEYAETGLSEISGLIGRREYNRSLVKSRQLADRVIRSYASERGIEYTGLAETIERLYSGGYINMTSRDAFHTIRIYGNKAVQEGDNEQSDAEDAYYLVRNEIQTYLSRKQVSIDRTPVRVERTAQERTVRERGEADASERYQRRRPSFDDFEGGSRGDGPDMNYSSARERREARRTRDSERQRNDRDRSQDRRSGRRDDGYEKEGITLYDIFKVVVPIIAVILIVIIVRSLIPGSSSTKESITAPTVTETVTETEPLETEAPETTPTETEPPVIEYQISADNVNIRYADNQNRIYTQLSRGAYIGPVTEIEGSDFVQFTLEGQSVVVRNDFIEPVN